MRHIFTWTSFLNEDFTSWMGGGTEHEIFEDPEHPDRVYKKRIGGEIDPQVIELFGADPSIFPRIYKSTSEWINMERLDTEKALAEYNTLTSFLEDTTDPLLLEDFFESLEEEAIPRLSQIFEDAPSHIREIWLRWRSTLERYMRVRNDFTQKWRQYLDSLSYEEISRMKRTSIIGNDLHQDQFGYSRDGKLKILDL